MLIQRAKKRPYEAVCAMSHGRSEVRRWPPERKNKDWTIPRPRTSDEGKELYAIFAGKKVVRAEIRIHRYHVPTAVKTGKNAALNL